MTAPAASVHGMYQSALSAHMHSLSLSRPCPRTPEGMTYTAEHPTSRPLPPFTHRSANINVATSPPLQQQQQPMAMVGLHLAGLQVAEDEEVVPHLLHLARPASTRHQVPARSCLPSRLPSAACPRLPAQLYSRIPAAAFMPAPCASLSGASACEPPQAHARTPPAARHQGPRGPAAACPHNSCAPRCMSLPRAGTPGLTAASTGWQPVPLGAAARGTARACSSASSCVMGSR